MIRPELTLPNDIGSIVHVTWRDAYFDFDEPEEPREDYVVDTVGYLIRFGDRFVSVGQEKLPEDDGYRAVTHIPRGMVLDIRTLG